MEIKEWQQFWLWTVVWGLKKVDNNNLVKCKCKCWFEKYVRIYHLQSWHSNWCMSCMAKERWKRDGKRYDKRFYWIYYALRTRCYNRNSNEYQRYWKRGIICERNSFKEFENDMYSSYKKHCKEYWEKDTTIDRIDWNGNYCKDNCRWATQKEQADNKKTTVKVVENWIKFNSLKDYCKYKWYVYCTWQKKIQKLWIKNLII
jgi:hypothetical protein